MEEFLQRQYLSLSHLNPRIDVDGDVAVVVNDLDALVLGPDDEQAHRVRRGSSDRWTLRRVDGTWRIAKLEVNRALQPPRPENDEVTAP